MTMYDFLKSTAVLAGLATGSAAIATTLNGIGSYFDFGGSGSAIARSGDSDEGPRNVFAAAEGGRTMSILDPEGAAAAAGGAVVAPALRTVASEPTPASYNLALFDETGAPGVSLGRMMRGLAALGGGAAAPAAVRAAANGVSSGPVPMTFGNLSPLGSMGVPSGEPAVLALEDPGEEIEGPGSKPVEGVTPVPLPAGGGLLLAGLIGLGLVRRRRG